MSEILKILWEMRPKGEIEGMRDRELISYRDTLLLMYASAHCSVTEHGVDIKNEIDKTEDEILRRMKEDNNDE